MRPLQGAKFNCCRSRRSWAISHGPYLRYPLRSPILGGCWRSSNLGKLDLIEIEMRNIGGNQGRLRMMVQQFK